MTFICGSFGSFGSFVVHLGGPLQYLAFQNNLVNHAEIIRMSANMLTVRFGKDTDPELRDKFWCSLFERGDTGGDFSKCVTEFMKRYIAISYHLLR